MPHFVVAGAGHGGLTAALALAKAGHSVEVIERQAEHNLGHDWTDVFEPRVCSRNGFPDLPEERFGAAYWNTLVSPSKQSHKRPPMYKCREVHVWRKELIRHLVSTCKEAGVAFRFETEILGPLLEGDKVIGVRTSIGDFPADMVIDAAGGRSPVRMGLPESSLVPRSFEGRMFHCWRGLFERLPGGDPPDRFKTYMYHMGRRGISWVIADDARMDVLIGSMDGPISDEEAAAGLADLREDNPLLGTALLHGGQSAAIPVRRPLAVMVTDGYAAVGDSAAMPDPFGGSGINLAMDAGSLLAEVLLKCNGDFSAANLWEYQYRFFTWTPPAEFPEGTGAKPAVQRAETDVFKNSLMSMSAGEVELMFQRDILSVELAFLGKELGPKDAVKLALRNLDQLGLLAKLVKMVLAGGKIKKIVSQIPAIYTQDAAAKWADEYEKFYV